MWRRWLSMDERLNGNFYYRPFVEGYDLYSVNAALDSTLLDNFAPFMSWREKARERKTPENAAAFQWEYKLRNGKRERRNYIVAEKDIQETIKALFETPEFAEKIYPGFLAGCEFGRRYQYQQPVWKC